jgi:hypothetical protein
MMLELCVGDKIGKLGERFDGDYLHWQPASFIIPPFGTFFNPDHLLQ